MDNGTPELKIRAWAGLMVSSRKKKPSKIETPAKSDIVLTAIHSALTISISSESSLTGNNIGQLANDIEIGKSIQPRHAQSQFWHRRLTSLLSASPNGTAVGDHCAEEPYFRQKYFWTRTPRATTLASARG